MYRICKQFEFQAAHILSKHPGKCRYPHGHTYKIEVSITSKELDENEMVCDFHAISAVVREYLKNLDHSIMLNSEDLANCAAMKDNPRTIIFESHDPTSEVLAKKIFEHIQKKMGSGKVVSEGTNFTINPSARLERVRVWETSTAWAEYQRAVSGS